MKTKYVLASLLFVLAAGMVCPIAGAQVYRWTDSSGEVHYGDTPPTSGQYERASPAVTPSRTGNAISENLPDFSKQEQEKKRADEDKAQSERLAEFKQKNCKLARSNLKKLQGYKARHALIRGDNGELRRMTEDERQHRIKVAKSVIEKDCKE